MIAIHIPYTVQATLHACSMGLLKGETQCIGLLHCQQ